MTLDALLLSNPSYLVPSFKKKRVFATIFRLHFQEKSKKRNEKNEVGKVHSTPFFLGYSLTRLWVTSCVVDTFQPRLGTFATFGYIFRQTKVRQVISRLRILTLIAAQSIKCRHMLLGGYAFLAIKKSICKKCRIGDSYVLLIAGLFEQNI